MAAAKKPTEKTTASTRNSSKSSGKRTLPENSGLLVDLGIRRGHLIGTTFSSPDSFLGKRFVVWDPRASFNNYRPKSKLKGLPFFGEAEYTALGADIERRKYEFEKIFQSGGCIFMLSQPAQKFYAQAGRISLILDDRANTLLDFISLFFSDIKTQVARGKNFDFLTDPIAAHLSACRSALIHEVFIESPDLVPLARIPGSDEIVAGYKKIGNGFLVLLPNILSQEEPVPDEHEGLASEDISKRRTAAWIQRWNLLLDALIEIDNDLRSRFSAISAVEDLPQWIKGYTTRNELMLEREVAMLRDAAKEAQSKLSRTESLLEEQRSRKFLLTATGKQLEVEVARCMRSIGFEVEEDKTSRADLIIRDGDKCAVVEIKGYKSSAGEQDAVQLNKWVSIFHDEEGFEPKGILVVNAFRERTLRDREIAFPDQMLPYSKKRGLALVTTLQLFCAELAKDVDRSRVESFKTQLFETDGIVAEFSDYSIFLFDEGEP